jgi:hypothetical protein
VQVLGVGDDRQKDREPCASANSAR